MAPSKKPSTKKPAAKKKPVPSRVERAAPAAKMAATKKKATKKKAAAPVAAKKPAARKAAAPAKKPAAPAKKPAAKKPAAKPAAKSSLRRDKLIVRPTTPQPLVERDRVRLLRDGERFGAATVALHPIAQLHLPTGELVTCDPFLVDGEPLARKVAPGTYPVTLAVATFGDKGKGDQRVAAATVQLRVGAPTRWEVATFSGKARKKGGEPGYPVDAGTGCLMDVATQAIIKAEPPGWPTPSYKALEKQLLTDRYQHTWSWADYQPDPASTGNCVAFMTGWGDGVYSSYWGLDDSGAPVCLVTDFDVFTDEDWSAS